LRAQAIKNFARQQSRGFTRIPSGRTFRLPWLGEVKSL
jgi:hypothetical protein